MMYCIARLARPNNLFNMDHTAGDLMEDMSTPLLDSLNKKLDNPAMSCSEHQDIFG